MKKILAPLMAATLFLMSCSDLFNSYGKKISVNDKSEVFYKDGASESEAKQLGDALLKMGYFDTSKAKSVQLTKDKDSSYVVRFVYDQAVYEKNRDQINTIFWYWQDLLSDNAFNGKKTHIILADEKMKDFATLEDVHKIKVSDSNHVYFKGNAVKESDAKNVGDKLVEGKFMDYTSGDVLLTKEKGSWNIRFLPNPEKIANKEQFYATMENYQYLIGKYLLDGDDVKLIVMDNDFNDVKSFNDISSDRKAQLDEAMKPSQQQQDQTQTQPQQPDSSAVQPQQ